MIHITHNVYFSNPLLLPIHLIQYKQAAKTKDGRSSTYLHYSHAPKKFSNYFLALSKALLIPSITLLKKILYQNLTFTSVNSIIFKRTTHFIKEKAAGLHLEMLCYQLASLSRLSFPLQQK